MTLNKDPNKPNTCRHYYASLLTKAGAYIDAVKNAVNHVSIITCFNEKVKPFKNFVIEKAVSVPYSNREIKNLSK